jgi:predicted phosphodiesterase
MTKQPTKSELARELRSRFPDAPTLTLAKKLAKEHFETFLSVEEARSILRYIEGKKGVQSRKDLGSKTAFVMEKERSRNPFNLPKSYAKGRKHFDIKGQKVLILSDIHIPYHDIDALSVAIQTGIDEDVDTVVLNGDALDCHMISDFVKDPKKRKFKDELYAMRSFLSELRGQFPQAEIIYKEGNHEERYWRYMRVKAPELFDIDAFDFPTLTHCDKHDIKWLDGKSKINIGGLSIFHGHEFGKQFLPSVNVARGLFLKTKANAMCGHHHQTAEHTERDVNGKVITCWGVGCLSELSPDYNPYSKYNHGFAIITRGINKAFHVKNYRIHEGAIY